MGELILEKGRGYAYHLTYHIAWCTKDRQPVFVNKEYQDELSDILFSVAREKEFEIHQMYIESDHVHILISCKPQHYIPDLTKTLKGGTAKKLQLRLPDLFAYLEDNHIWDSSYMVVSGYLDASKEVKEYVINYKKYRK